MNIWRLVVLLLAGLFPIVGCGGNEDSADEIVRISRQNNSGTYHYFREAVLGENREFKLGSNDMSGSKDVVEMVTRTPGAIGYSGMGYATEEVKMLRVSQDTGAPAVAPSVPSAMDGSYPLARPLYIYVVGEPTSALKHFVDWIRSPEGQKIVEEMGYVPVEAVEMTDSSTPPDATIKIAGSDTMINLSQAWAEEYMAKYANVSLQVSGGGSGVGIKALTDGTIDLANSSRDIEPDERQLIESRRNAPVQEFTVGLDALAIYVHKSNPLDEISIRQLAEIFGDGGAIVRWSQLRSGTE
jgi:ABC-type phosphate transport system substrate-binding protein